MYNDDRTGDNLAIFVVGSLYRVRSADDSRNIHGHFDDRSPNAATPDGSRPAALMRFLWLHMFPLILYSIFHGISHQARKGRFTARRLFKGFWSRLRTVWTTG
jgi:hypothetical protein